jgi:hypothetical protein
VRVGGANLFRQSWPVTEEAERGRSMTHRGSFLLILGILLFCIALGAQGQEETGIITLNRLGDRVTLGPGEEYAGVFVVSNPSDIVKTVIITLQDFVFYEQGGVKILDAGSLGERSLAKTFSFSPEQLVLPPGGKATVQYEFTLPEEGTGPHWVGLLVREAEPATEGDARDTGGMGFVMNVKIQYLFMVIQMCADACPEKEARLIALDVDGLINEETGARTVMTRATVENTSDRVLACTGYVEIRGPTGESIARQEIPQFTMLPEATRIVERRFDGDLFGDDQYIAICVIDFGGESLIGGQWGFSGKDLFTGSSEP